MASGTPFEEFKILLIGDVRVGKTSFFTKYTRNIVNKNEPPTIGVDYSTKSIVLRDGTIVKAKIWDTAGSEKYKAITTAHYRKSVGAMLFYDITDQITFNHTRDWLNEIQEHTEDDIVVMLVGNKLDLTIENPASRVISEKEARDFAAKNGLLYSETSAKTGQNVKEAFETLVENIYEKQKERGINRQTEDEDKIKIDKSFDRPPENQKGCCN